ncbi:MAG: hypothetical protein H6888_11585 [Nitratireductor sp.]|nr:hypothetical protein [Nitratireductor sp.]
MDRSDQLEDIDLTLPLSGSEGVDINYISRVRTQYLFAQHHALVAQTQFADAKAAALLTLIGLIALRGPLAPYESSGSIFTWIYLACVALCILFALLSVVPRFPSASLRSAMYKADRWSWPGLAADEVTPEAFAGFMQTSEVSQLVHSVARSNVHISRILLRKFFMLRLAFGFAVILLAMTGARLAGLM